MPGPDKFGDKTTWLRGHLAHTKTPFVYYDLYKCEAIMRLNTNDFSLYINGRVVELVDCEVRYDLTEISPPP